MAKNNRVCKVCGAEYSFCPTCAGVHVTEKYKTMFCSKNCRDIFHTLSRYTIKDISKDEAKEILASLDMSKHDQFSEQVKADVDEITDAAKKTFKKKVKEEPVVIDEADLDVRPEF